MASSSHDAYLPKKRERIEFDPEEYILRKRLPRRLPARKNDVYINMKTNFCAQLARCQKLIDAGESEIYIHGLGKAVDRAINIAHQLQSKNSSFERAVNTSTVDIVDDIEPQTDSGEYGSYRRSNSSIHIKLYKKAELSVMAQT